MEIKAGQMVKLDRIFPDKLLYVNDNVRSVPVQTSYVIILVVR